VSEVLGVPPVLRARGHTFGLRRVWPREGGTLHLEYAGEYGRLGAQRPSGAAEAGQLAHPTGLEPPTTAKAPGGTQRLVVHWGGLDRKLTAVVALAGAPGARVVCHVPERRAVVRRRDGCYARVLRAGRSGSAVEAVLRVEEAAGRAFAVPRLVEHDEATATAVWAALPGPTLLDLGRREGATAALGRAWFATGRTLAVLHEADPTGLPHHTAHDDVVAARRWTAAAHTHGLLPKVPPDHPAYRALLDGTPGPTGLLHRDLHDKQVLVGPTIGLLDLDTLAQGERAVDLGNILAHLDLRTAQGLLSPEQAALAAAAFLAGVQADAATLARVPAYRAVAGLRLTGLYAFRPRWHALAMVRAHRTAGAFLQ
jgi:aminoglycoside phosphotransferase (APT) family kinase protein